MATGLSVKKNESLNISHLFGQLIKLDKESGKYVMDGSISSFLYFTFPRDLFIRALSLLESHEMFIYVLEKELSETSDDGTQNILIEKLYEMSLHELNFLFRLIVKNQNEGKDSIGNGRSLIYVDILHWTCSCPEFSEEILKQTNIHNKNIISLKDLLLLEVDDVEAFSNDRFCQLDSYSLSKQRYLRHDKVMCPHLLAYAILLVSNKNVLKYFIQQERNVFLMSIQSINEWLNLHINIIV